MGVSGQRHAPAALYPRGKDPPVPIGEEAVWAPEPVWTQRLEEKSSVSVGDRTPIVQPVVRLSPVSTPAYIFFRLHALHIRRRNYVPFEKVEMVQCSTGDHSEQCYRYCQPNLEFLNFLILLFVSEGVSISESKNKE
jgi:hypothetical protein